MADQEERMKATYEKPVIVDHGSLQQLTASCLQGSGGDQLVPGGSVAGLSFGTSGPGGCTSN
jgi:hypothetical protein